MVRLAIYALIACTVTAIALSSRVTGRRSYRCFSRRARVLLHVKKARCLAQGTLGANAQTLDPISPLHPVALIQNSWFATTGVGSGAGGVMDTHPALSGVVPVMAVVITAAVNGLVVQVMATSRVDPVHVP